MTEFWWGVIASVAVAILYGLFFAQREEKIRAYLRRTRSGLIRRLYVLAFVGAVRGRAVANDTGLLGWLILIGPFLLAFWLFNTARPSASPPSRTQSNDWSRGL